MSKNITICPECGAILKYVPNGYSYYAVCKVCDWKSEVDHTAKARESLRATVNVLKSIRECLSNLEENTREIAAIFDNLEVVYREKEKKHD